jgi:hypothetical protein
VNEAPVALQYSKPKVVLQYILEGLVEDMDWVASESILILFLEHQFRDLFR